MWVWGFSVEGMWLHVAYCAIDGCAHLVYSELEKQDACLRKREFTLEMSQMCNFVYAWTKQKLLDTL